MLQFRQTVFHGFVTDLGGRTSHTAIVRAQPGHPRRGGRPRGQRADPRRTTGSSSTATPGLVIVDPSAIILEEYRHRQSERALEKKRLQRLRHTPAVTLDGHEIELLANIELPEDAPPALAAGAVGVGLFRTEFLFMNRAASLPDEEEQFEAYRARGGGDERPAGDHPHHRRRRRQAAGPAVRRRLRDRAEPGARAARDPLVACPSRTCS